MKKQEAFKILVLIESVYPHFKFKNETVLIWFQLCENFNFNLVTKKLSIHFRSSPYPPLMEEVTSHLFNYYDIQETWERDVESRHHSWNDEYILAK
jgi:hypothetical protein